MVITVTSSTWKPSNVSYCTQCPDCAGAEIWPMLAPSDMVFFDDSKADTSPILDLFYRWSIDIKRRQIKVRNQYTIVAQC